MTKPADSVAAVFSLARGDVVVSTHCGSRGLGHQIGTEFSREMTVTAPAHGITLPDLELAGAPIWEEEHEIPTGQTRGPKAHGERRRLFVHRKGATRAFGAGHPDLPAAFAVTASRFSSAAAWAHRRRSWSDRRCGPSMHLPRPATALGDA